MTYLINHAHILLAIIAAAGVGIIAITICGRLNGPMEEEE